MIISRYHPDHLAVGQAALAAIYPASQNLWDFPELMAEGLQPHKVAEIYISAAPVQNHGIDITTTSDLKIAALCAHTSQVGSEFADLAELETFLRGLNAEVGKKYGYEYAEEYHRVEN